MDARRGEADFGDEAAGLVLGAAAYGGNGGGARREHPHCARDLTRDVSAAQDAEAHRAWWRRLHWRCRGRHWWSRRRRRRLVSVRCVEWSSASVYVWPEVSSSAFGFRIIWTGWVPWIVGCRRWMSRLVLGPGCGGAKLVVWLGPAETKSKSVFWSI